MTQAIVTVARPLEISVHDHIIVGKNGRASLNGCGRYVGPHCIDPSVRSMI
jgi:DNA repair protein RadC